MCGSILTHLQAFIYGAGLSVKAMAEKESKRVDLSKEVCLKLPRQPILCALRAMPHPCMLFGRPQPYAFFIYVPSQ